MDKTCCVCCQPFFEGGESFTLTAEEKALLKDAPDVVHYCRPCSKVMKDKQAGANLIKGLYEMKLRELGVNQASRRAQLFYDKLLTATSKRLH
jgi:hypothetical protein